jgi:hypothetical protein
MTYDLEHVERISEDALDISPVQKDSFRFFLRVDADRFQSNTVVETTVQKNGDRTYVDGVLRCTTDDLQTIVIGYEETLETNVVFVRKKELLDGTIFSTDTAGMDSMTIASMSSTERIASHLKRDPRKEFLLIMANIGPTNSYTTRECMAYVP